MRWHSCSFPSPDGFIRYADHFGVSMDYLFCRTDDPHGAFCSEKPACQVPDPAAFIEMCFAPGTDANRRLKAYLLRMLKEGMDE